MNKVYFYAIQSLTKSTRLLQNQPTEDEMHIGFFFLRKMLKSYNIFMFINYELFNE